jgi:hypothetical protein
MPAARPSAHGDDPAAVSGFFWLAFAVLVVFATVQLAMWILEWVLEERSRKRSSPNQVTRGIRG